MAETSRHYIINIPGDTHILKKFLFFSPCNTIYDA